MGNSPSKIPDPAVAETLRDCLRALEIKETKETGPEVEKGYVYVADQERMDQSLSNNPRTRHTSHNNPQLLTGHQLLGQCPFQQPRNGKENCYRIQRYKHLS